MKLLITAALASLAISSAAMAQTKPFDFKGLSMQSTPAEVAKLTGKACENDNIDGEKIAYCDLPKRFLPTLDGKTVEMASVIFDAKGLQLLKVDVTGDQATALFVALDNRYGGFKIRDDLYTWDFDEGRMTLYRDRVNGHTITCVLFVRADQLKDAEPATAKPADF